MGFISCPIATLARWRPQAPALLYLPDNQSISYAELDQAISDRVRRTIYTNSIVPLVPELNYDTIITLFALFRQGKCVLLQGPHGPSRTAPMPELPSDPMQQPPVYTPVYANAWSLHTPATLMYTSGSSNTPKAVVHTLAQHYWGALGGLSLPNSIHPDSRVFLGLPLYHVSGFSLLLRCFLRGATLVLATEKRPLPTILRLGSITHTSIVLPQLVQLASDAGAYPALKQLLFGGSACPEALYLKAQHLPVVYSYGLTELGGQVATGLQPTGFTPVAYRAFNCRNNILYIRGRCLSLGYLLHDDTGWRLTQQTDPDGYINTRDTGYIDSQNRLHITGRLDDLFISGGENIQPQQIESVLLTHPDITVCCVVPKPCATYGQRPVAFIHPFKPPSESWLQAHLHRYWQPVAYYPWPDSVPWHKPNRKQLAGRVCY